MVVFAEYYQLSPLPLFVFFTAVSLFPFILFGWLVYRSFKATSVRKNLLQRIAKENGWSYNNAITAQHITNTGSFRDGSYANYISGSLVASGNRFYICDQYEIRGGGKNSRSYNRMIAGISVPNTQSQLIFNSKHNSDSVSGGNLESYKRQQRISLEGDFNEYFDVFVPDNSKRDALVFLSPDVMSFMIDNFTDFDVEIVDSMLYIYQYSYIDPENVRELIQKIDRLITEFRLRVKDVRNEATTNAAVSRTAIDMGTRGYLIRSKRAIVSTAIIFGVYVLFFGANLKFMDVRGFVIAVFLFGMIGWVLQRVARGKELAFNHRFFNKKNQNVDKSQD